MTDSKSKAVQLLKHYLRVAGLKTGINLDAGDFHSEMEELVEAISDYTLDRLDERAKRRKAEQDLADEDAAGWTNPQE